MRAWKDSGEAAALTAIVDLYNPDGTSFSYGYRHVYQCPPNCSGSVAIIGMDGPSPVALYIVEDELVKFSYMTGPRDGWNAEFHIDPASLRDHGFRVTFRPDGATGKRIGARILRKYPRSARRAAANANAYLGYQRWQSLALMGPVQQVVSAHGRPTEITAALPAGYVRREEGALTLEYKPGTTDM